VTWRKSKNSAVRPGFIVLTACLLVSCGSAQREHQAVEVAAIQGIMSGISKGGDRRPIVFFRTIDAKEVLRIQRSTGLRFGWQYMIDARQGVVDQRTREKGAVLLLAKSEVTGKTARVGFIVITNKNSDYHWNCTLEKSDGAWHTTRVSREPRPTHY